MTTEIDEFEKQCGRVFLTKIGLMKFYCTLCENKFHTFDDFAVHVSAVHVSNPQDDENAMIAKNMLETSMNNEGEAFSVNDENPNFYSDGGENEIVTFEVSLLEEPKTASDKKLTRKSESQSQPNQNVQSETQKQQYSCPDCDYSTSLKVKLVEHVRRHFGDRPYSCDFCEKRFYTTSDRNRHLTRQHADKIEPKILTPEELELKTLIKSSLIDLGNNSFQCKACNFTCEGRSSIWYHIRRHSAYKAFECNICSKRFYTSNALNTHIRSHTGEKPYLCTECGSAFSTSSKLTTHRKRHNNIRDKECTICQRRFFNNAQLECHMAVHSDDRPFACEICDSTFKRQKTLSNHMKVHYK